MTLLRGSTSRLLTNRVGKLGSVATSAFTFRRCIVELKPLATAIAELDTVCDEYERALRRGDVRVDDLSHCLDRWLERVTPDLRSWLRDELEALCADFHPIVTDNKSFSGTMQTEAWRAIVQCETFRPLSREVKLALAVGFESQEFQAGERLIRAGQQATGLFLITSGQVHVIGGNKRERYELDVDGPGSVVGEMSTLTGYPCSADVVAETSVRALFLSLATFDALRETNPEVEIALSQLVSDRLGHRRLDALCGKKLGGYRLQQCLGIGAMGVVYEATSETESRVAVKMLRHRFIYSPDVICRFDQEAKLLSRLAHENVVGLRGHFVAYRTRFIVLELFDGADLRQLIRDRGPVDESLAKAILGQIAAGLLYAHEHGVLHFDLKPANILLDRNGRVAITDFGLSRLIKSDGCDRERVGTPAYMPPEQFLMCDLGPHCDWYSLACIAYELVTGERLFQSDKSSRFLDEKMNATELTWPNDVASQEFRRHWESALQPAAAERHLDLREIANWSRPVPELAKSLNPNPSKSSR